MTDLTDPSGYVPPELGRAIEDLTAEYRGIYSRRTVERVVVDSYMQLARGARVLAYLSLLAARFARDRLRATATVEGLLMTDKPEVLFVCVHNAGRSQMAAGLLNHHANGAVVVRSAGSAPADGINPAVIEAMAEVGIDISEEFPKPLTTEAVRASDVVISMGCGDACPVFAGKRYLDWELGDPAGKELDTVRRIRDDIDARVRGLLAELVPASALKVSHLPDRTPVRTSAEAVGSRRRKTSACRCVAWERPPDALVGLAVPSQEEDVHEQR